MQGEHWIILALIALLGILILFSYSYNFFADWKQRVIKLEKKNGYEQYQIDQLKAENKELKELVFSLKRKTQQLQNKLERYEQRK